MAFMFVGETNNVNAVYNFRRGDASNAPLCYLRVQCRARPMPLHVVSAAV